MEAAALAISEAALVGVVLAYYEEDCVVAVMEGVSMMVAGTFAMPVAVATSVA